MSFSTEFKYNVEDINNNIKRTNILLRSINSIRNLSNDLKSLMDHPTPVKFFWTVIQISRTYSALRRLLKLVSAESKIAAILGGVSPPTIFEVGEGPPIEVPRLDFSQFNVRVDAFLNNLPMPLERLDLSDLPLKVEEVIQRILEEDAEETVADAKAILHSRILHPDQSTGFLESSIYWQPEVFGTRIVANAPYAWWVERGHRIVNPRSRKLTGEIVEKSVSPYFFGGHHYMLGAVDLARQRLPEKITYELNQLITQET